MCSAVAVIKLRKEDVDVLVAELEFTKDQAENLLKTHKGNLAMALEAHVRGQ